MGMSNYIKLQNNLIKLKLLYMKNNLDRYLDLFNEGEKSIVDVLYELTRLELLAKEKSAMNACIRIANFPYLKDIEDFDFDFQPGINREKILDLMTLRFVEHNENILFVGTPGVGKTHLAVSIGIECAKHRYSTYFIHFQNLMSQLKNALKENRLETRLKHFSKYKVLIIDEIGYLPIDTDASNLFFQLISKRYEKHSTIITTNMPFSDWVEIFGSPVLAQAILDRLLHHSHVISIKGESYRLKEKMEFFVNTDALSNG